MKSVLYIQHASSPGGSCVSLLYTMKAVERAGYRPILALASPSQEVAEFYRSNDIVGDTEYRLAVWHHSTVAPRPLRHVRTWLDAARLITQWKRTKANTLRLVSKHKPDLVHLNSMCLSPSAQALFEAKVPFVWHVREPPPVGRLDPRTSIIGAMLKKYPSASIFISEADRRAWVGSDCGIVVRNFIDFSRFDHQLRAQHLIHQHHLNPKSHRVLYMGGLRTVKGIFVLLEALKRLRESGLDVCCLMIDSVYNPPRELLLDVARTVLPIIGSGTTGQRAERYIRNNNLESVCVRTGFVQNVQDYISISDVVVFPSIKPHFARPIIEASAMAKPVIASRLAGMEELVEDGVTGALVPPGDSDALAQAVAGFIQHPEAAERAGRAGRAFAKRTFDVKRNIEVILSTYADILASKPNDLAG